MLLCVFCELQYFGVKISRFLWCDEDILAGLFHPEVIGLIVRLWWVVYTVRWGLFVWGWFGCFLDVEKRFGLWGRRSVCEFVLSGLVNASIGMLFLSCRVGWFFFVGGTVLVVPDRWWGFVIGFFFRVGWCAVVGGLLCVLRGSILMFR